MECVFTCAPSAKGKPFLFIKTKNPGLITRGFFDSLEGFSVISYEIFPISLFLPHKMPLFGDCPLPQHEFYDINYSFWPDPVARTNVPRYMQVTGS